MTSEKELSHAERNGMGWMETIREHIACLECDRERLEELREERQAAIDSVHESPELIGHFGYTGCDSDCYDTQKEAEEAALENWGYGDELAELEAAVRIDGEEIDADTCRERIEESPLSVQVRDGWKSAGAESEGPEEFEILLSTGGPALRIVGNLDQHCQPTRARLEYQDWGTPWTEMILGSDDYDTLLKWASVFYFGG